MLFTTDIQDQLLYTVEEKKKEVKYKNWKQTYCFVLPCSFTTPLLQLCGKELLKRQRHIFLGYSLHSSF